MARPRTNGLRCIADKPLNRDHWQAARTADPQAVPPIECPICKIGPLHDRPNCECSYVRKGHRICRHCAIALDILLYGKSRISNDIGVVSLAVRDSIKRGLKVNDF